jgi:pyruvate carboxylase
MRAAKALESRWLGAMEALPAGKNLRFVCESQVQGMLYDLGSYPGLKEGAGLVQGEVYEVLSPEVWTILDPYEDYFPEDEAGSLYLRKSIELMDEPGYAWTYIYNQKVADNSLIQDGDWRRYSLEEKS